MGGSSCSFRPRRALGLPATPTPSSKASVARVSACRAAPLSPIGQSVGPSIARGSGNVAILRPPSS
eukprot:7382992-Lingulodinium_polyedra.AAC.1